jgi:hypothetical protein
MRILGVGGIRDGGRRWRLGLLFEGGVLECQNTSVG